MRTTTHGRKRGYERTILSNNEILSIVRTGLYVNLGFSRKWGTFYFLFYDPKQMDYRIAVVSEDLTKLVSVWKKNYYLPENVRNVTTLIRQRARKKYFDHFFRNHEDIEIRARIEVNEGSSIIFRQNLGNIYYSHAYADAGILNFLRKRYGPLVLLVEANKSAAQEVIKYDVFLNHVQTGLCIKHTRISHRKLKKRLILGPPKPSLP